LGKTVQQFGFRTIEIRNRGEVLYHFPIWVQRLLIGVLGLDRTRNRFIRNYHLRLLWASFVDGKLSATLGIGDQMYGFFRKLGG
jgi:hypothetical protein